MDTLRFSWLDNPVDIEKDLQLPQFSLEGYSKRDCSQNYTAGKFEALLLLLLLTDLINSSTIACAQLGLHYECRPN